jgi:formyltetrahydrofolate deformylase
LLIVSLCVDIHIVRRDIFIIDRVFYIVKWAKCWLGQMPARAYNQPPMFCMIFIGVLQRMTHPTETATLLIASPDRQGLVAAITQFLAHHHGNILHLDQHVEEADEAGGGDTFFMRVEWDLHGFQLPKDQIAAAFDRVSLPLNMTYELRFSSVLPRMAVFVTKESHCLYDILSRYQAGEWPVEIPLIVSNHDTLAGVAHKFGIPFQRFEITKDNKAEQEQAQLALLAQHKIDLVVLARYMQIVTPTFIGQYPNRIINIHHSFLPAFVGAQPYLRAHQRGVKLIGATSHYVTAELDAGPILEQDVLRVNHRDSVADLVRKGKDVEKLVLSRAIRYHLLNQVLVYRNKTVIFA